MSTISPIATRAMSARLRENGVGFLDAPVSGGEKGAIEGTLSIMIGGAAEDVERARPLFEAMGKTIVHVGDAGAGQVAKACNQLVVASTIEAVAEALTLAQQAGVDPARVREALMGGFAGSKIMEMHGQRMLDDNFQPGFRARLHLKDARIVLDTAHDLGVPVPAFEPVAAALERLVEEGGGDLDHSALVTLVRQGAQDAAPCVARSATHGPEPVHGPAAGARARRSRATTRRSSTRSAWPTGWGSTRSGRPSSTAWTTATCRRSCPRSPRSRARPNGSGWAPA